MEIFSEIIDVKDIWKTIYSKSRKLTFYQSYEWNYLLEKDFYNQRFSKYFGCQLKYYVYNSQIIAPLIIDKRHRQVNILGYKAMSDYLSLICPDEISLIPSGFFNLLIQMIGYDYEYHFDKLNQNLPFCEYVEKISSSFCMSKIEKECVHIDLRMPLDSFYNTLSKNVRQNYRTAKNRLLKDGYSYSVELSYAKIPQKDSIELLDIYHERREDCDGRASKLHQLIRNILSAVGIEKYIDVLSEYAKEVPLFCGKIIIDGKDVGAFCEGQYNRDEKSISISRIATKGVYYKYSPGLIMLIDIIEKIKNDVDYFDLTRGSEDYKFKLGGSVHYNYMYTIKSLYNND